MLSKVASFLAFLPFRLYRMSLTIALFLLFKDFIVPELVYIATCMGAK